MKSVFALVDCNNFYASCERLFRPDLASRPIVVLSNNDGCVVARSAEAKQIGIKMGEPAFKIHHLVIKHKIEVFSSNYALYGDISNRVMQTLEELAPHVEVYSIDEAFLDCTGITDLKEFGQQIRSTILKRVGINVCVGFGHTKTLAKLANRTAKKHPKTEGVVDLTAKEKQITVLSRTAVTDIWGIGKRLGTRLILQGVNTALDLSMQNHKTIRKQYSVVVERTIRELQGESCIELESIPPTKQQIVSSRSFGQRVSDKTQIFEAICNHVSRASEKLRQEKQVCQHLNIFIRTGMFNISEPKYSNHAGIKLLMPTSDTRILFKESKRLLEHIWKDGYRYAKAGVQLSDFYPEKIQQKDMFLNNTNEKLVMNTMDEINKKTGLRVYFAAQGVKKAWQMNRNKLSPNYTTKWQEIPKIR